MYSYNHDPETGGLLLTDTLSSFSKEPRPVYAAELDLLGFDAFWTYDKQNDVPYMWAESQWYWYRGQRVAKTSGGSLYAKPQIVLETDADGNTVLPAGSALKPVDLAAMVEKNRAILEHLERETVKRIYDVYRRYKDRLDCFHVAFSGGKDSIVLLELVKRALPSNAFITVFGDTGMEFPDTYDVVAKIEAQCKADGLAFYRAASHFKPEESWKLFGPPSRVLRWCCSVHKAAPQTLKLREILGKQNYVGMDFVGVRAHESLARSEYEYENYGKKQKGQYSYNPILEWGSAEVWLYIFLRGLPVNAAYIKGNSRAGCLFCPLGSGGKADWFRGACYPDEVKRFTDMIVTSTTDKDVKGYLQNGGWVERRNGRDIKGNEVNYSETAHDGVLDIKIPHPKTDWREWCKTVAEADTWVQRVVNDDNGLTVTIPGKMMTGVQGKLIRQILHKTAQCVGCGVCETNCRFGCISFKNGLHIENCHHCGQCHKIDSGCLAYHSHSLPQSTGEKKMSLNTFADHAPKLDWLRGFFAQPGVQSNF